MEKNTVVIANKQLPKTILNKLNELRQNGKWCDLRLQVPSHVRDAAPVIFPVHSCILAVASETFAGMMDNKVECAILPDADSYNFSLCVDFLYGNEIVLPEHDLPCLIDCAEKLHLSGLLEECKSTLKLPKVDVHETGSIIKKEPLEADEVNIDFGTDRPISDQPVDENVTEKTTASRKWKRASSSSPKTKAKVRKTTAPVQLRSSPRTRRKPPVIYDESDTTVSDDNDSDATIPDAGSSDSDFTDGNVKLEQATLDQAEATLAATQDETEAIFNELTNNLSTDSSEISRMRRCAVKVPLAEEKLADSFIEDAEKKPSMLTSTKGSPVEENGHDALMEYMEDSSQIMSSPGTEPITKLEPLDLPKSPVKKRKYRKISKTPSKPRPRRRRRYRIKPTMEEWLKKNSKEIGDICFDEIAEEMGIPHEMRPLLEFSKWAAHLRSGKFRGTPMTAYRANYVNYHKEYSCERCKLMFKGAIQHRKHNQKEHGECFYCSICAKSFLSVASLKNHEQRHSSEKDIKCDMCDFQCYFKNELVQHKRRRHRDALGEEAFLCSKCGSSYGTAENLAAHDKRVHHKDEWKKDPRNKCDMCDYVGFQQKDLSRHKKNKHTKVKPHVCVICRRVAFKQRTQLYAHMRKVHETEPEKLKQKTIGNMFEQDPLPMIELLPPIPKEPKVYRCPHCDYKCLSSNGLKSHSVIHSDARPHACPLCPEAFKRRDVLTRHARRHHKIDLRTARYEFLGDGKKRRHEFEQTPAAQQEEHVSESEVTTTEVSVPDTQYFEFEVNLDGSS